MSVARRPISSIAQVTGLQAALDAKRVTEPYHLYVGASQPYTTIQAAVDAWADAGGINKAASVIHIAQGTYEEVINLQGQSNIAFIGEGRDLVTWKSSVGYYRYSPLVVGGSVLIKGITFIADHTGTPDWAYTAFASDNVSGAAYGLHIDDGTSTGEVVIEDCDIYSYQNAALGCGTRINQQIRLERCRIYALNDVAETIPYGSIYYHTSATASATGQAFAMRGCYVYSSGGVPVVIPSWGDDTPVPVRFNDCTLESGVECARLVLFSYGSGASRIKTFVTSGSRGNNEPVINAAVCSWETDCLNAVPPWGLGAIASGTFPATGGAIDHPGVYRFTSSTSANSGAYMLTNLSSFVIGGGESTDIIFKPLAAGIGTLVARLGFSDSASVSDPTDGMWIDLAGTTLSGKTNDGTGIATTASNYTVTQDTWYRGRVRVAADKSSVTFALFSMAGALLWTDALTTKIPTTGGTPSSVVAVSTGTSAVALLDLDYVSVSINRPLVR